MLPISTKYPKINYLGIEKYSSVLVRAIEKRAEHPEISNLYFLRYDAEYICRQITSYLLHNKSRIDQLFCMKSNCEKENCFL